MRFFLFSSVETSNEFLEEAFRLHGAVGAHVTVGDDGARVRLPDTWPQEAFDLAETMATDEVLELHDHYWPIAEGYIDYSKLPGIIENKSFQQVAIAGENKFVWPVLAGLLPTARLGEIAFDEIAKYFSLLLEKGNATAEELNDIGTALPEGLILNGCRLEKREDWV